MRSPSKKLSGTTYIRFYYITLYSIYFSILLLYVEYTVVLLYTYNSFVTLSHANAATLNCLLCVCCEIEYEGSGGASAR